MTAIAYCHQQAVDTQRHAGAVRQPMLQRGDEMMIDGAGGLATLAADCIFGLKSFPLLLCIGQFLVTVGQLKRAEVQFEALGQWR